MEDDLHFEQSYLQESLPTKNIIDIGDVNKFMGGALPPVEKTIKENAPAVNPGAAAPMMMGHPSMMMGHPGMMMPNQQMMQHPGMMMQPPPTQQQEVKYQICTLSYNFGGTEPGTEIWDDFYVQYPPISCKDGLLAAANKQGRVEYTLKASLNRNDPNGKLAYEGSKVVFTTCCYALLPHKGALKMPKLDPENPDGSALKSFIYEKKGTDGEATIMSTPMIYFKCFKYSNSQTLFTNLINDNPVDWNLLYNVEFEIAPLVHFKEFFIGQSKTVRSVVISAVITSIKPKNTESLQNRFTTNYKLANPQAKAIASSQFQRLMARNNGITNAQQSTSDQQTSDQQEPATTAVVPDGNITDNQVDEVSTQFEQTGITDQTEATDEQTEVVYQSPTIPVTKITPAVGKPNAKAKPKAPAKRTAATMTQVPANQNMLNMISNVPEIEQSFE